MASESLGFENRYEMWLDQVRRWADRHGITLDQAISILFEHGPEATLQRNLLSWAESSQFCARYFLAKFHDEMEPPPKMCACGEPLHYSDPNIQELVEKQIAASGEYATITLLTTGQKFLVQKHFIALHGVKAAELPELVKKYGFEEVTPLPDRDYTCGAAYCDDPACNTHGAKDADGDLLYWKRREVK
jgi:hypothetical protein